MLGLDRKTPALTARDGCEGRTNKIPCGLPDLPALPELAAEAALGSMLYSTAVRHRGLRPDHAPRAGNAASRAIHSSSRDPARPSCKRECRTGHPAGTGPFAPDGASIPSARRQRKRRDPSAGGGGCWDQEAAAVLRLDDADRSAPGLTGGKPECPAKIVSGGVPTRRCARAFACRRAY